MKPLCSIALVLILSSTAEFAFAQAGGVSGAVQYNKAGTPGGDTGFTTNGAGVLTETGTLPLTGATKGVVTFNPTISLTSTLPTGTNPAGILGTAYLSGNGAYQNGNDTLGYLFDTNFYGTGTWALGKGLQESVIISKARGQTPIATTNTS